MFYSRRVWKGLGFGKEFRCGGRWGGRRAPLGRHTRPRSVTRYILPPSQGGMCTQISHSYGTADLTQTHVLACTASLQSLYDLHDRLFNIICRFVVQWRFIYMLQPPLTLFRPVLSDNLYLSNGFMWYGEYRTSKIYRTILHIRYYYFLNRAKKAEGLVQVSVCSWNNITWTPKPYFIINPSKSSWVRSFT